MAMHFGPVRLPPARLPMMLASFLAFPVQAAAGLRPSRGGVFCHLPIGIVTRVKPEGKGEERMDTSSRSLLPPPQNIAKVSPRIIRRTFQ